MASSSNAKALVANSTMFASRPASPVSISSVRVNGPATLIVACPGEWPKRPPVGPAWPDSVAVVRVSVPFLNESVTRRFLDLLESVASHFLDGWVLRSVTHGH